MYTVYIIVHHISITKAHVLQYAIKYRNSIGNKWDQFELELSADSIFRSLLFRRLIFSLIMGFVLIFFVSFSWYRYVYIVHSVKSAKFWKYVCPTLTTRRHRENRWHIAFTLSFLILKPQQGNSMTSWICAYVITPCIKNRSEYTDIDLVNVYWY